MACLPIQKMLRLQIQYLLALPLSEEAAPKEALPTLWPASVDVDVSLYLYLYLYLCICAVRANGKRNEERLRKLTISSLCQSKIAA